MQKKIQIFVIIFLSLIGLGYADGGCNLCAPNSIQSESAPAVVPPQEDTAQDENSEDMEDNYDEDDDTVIIEEEEAESTDRQ